MTSTVRTAGSAFAADSNVFSRSLVWSAVVPGGSVTEPESCVEPPKSKKFLGTNASVAEAPTSRRSASTSTAALRQPRASTAASTGR